MNRKKLKKNPMTLKFLKRNRFYMYVLINQGACMLI